MPARGDLERVAAVLCRPRAGYVQQLDEARVAMSARAGEASRLLGVFVDRIRDLTLEELCELHDETFRHGQSSAVPLILARFAERRRDADDEREALASFTQALSCLEADRSPFAYAVKALCCLLLAAQRT